MKLSITSTEKLQNFYLKDLNDKTFIIELDTEQNIPEGWYNLIIPYVDKKVEISNISINGNSIKELIYTGFYTDGNGTTHQPANAVWDQNGYYSIWMHTQSGILWQSICDQIRSGDFGTNLFERYMLTVDKNIVIKEDCFDNILKSYFANGYGPRWWLKNDRFTPYKTIDDDSISKTDTNTLLFELKKCLPYTQKNLSGVQGWHRYGLKNGCADLPFVEINDLPSTVVQEFIKKVGYKRVIDIAIQTLTPNTAVPVHRDDHYRRKGYPYTSGAKKFYWNLGSIKDIYFKLGESGLLPLEKPMFVNTVEHVHAVVNQSEEERTVIHMYGEL